MTSVLTLEKIASAVGGRVRGDPTVRIAGVAGIDAAEATQITWITHLKYAEHLSSTKAGAILVPEEFGPTPMPAILCARVDVSVGRTINLFAPPQPQPPVGVHPAAVVDPTAVLGEGVAVGPCAVIDAGVTIGDQTILHSGVHVGRDTRIGVDCRMWNGVVLREGCTVGDRVVIHPNAVIGSDGFGFFRVDDRHHKIAHGGGLVIEDDVEIGACCAVDRAKIGVTRIGRGTKIDNLVQIGHNSVIGADCLIVAHCALAGSAILGNHVVLAGYSGVTEHVRIADGTTCLAQTIVTRDSAAGAVLSGTPARDDIRRRREQAAVARLPDLLGQVRDLTHRVQRLESSADHS